MSHRILLITQDFPPQKGGIQTYCKHLAIELHRQGCNVTVICPGSFLSDTATPDIPREISIYRIPVGTSWLWLPLLFVIGRIVKKFRPDTIIYGQWQCGIWHMFHTGLAKRYVTASLVHGRDLLTGLFGKWSPILCAQVLKRINLALPNSRAVAALYVSIVSSRTGVVPVPAETARQAVWGYPAYETVNPGIDARRFGSTDCSFLKERYKLHDSLILTTISRLVVRKNVASVIRLIPRLLKQFPQLRYIIGGTGPELDNLKALVVAHGIQKYVTFTGEIAEDELVLHMSLGDVFVLPSIQNAKDIEGFGIVFLEAACCGVPQVAFATGGIPDAIAHNVSGLLCERADEESLYATLVAVLNSKALRKNLATQGRLRALHEFTWETNAKKILKLVSIVSELRSV